MDLEIRRLTPELAEDYVRFFDVTPHDDSVDENKCYCLCWCGKDCEGEDFSTREKRREAAFRYVREDISRATSPIQTANPWAGATPTPRPTA